MGVEILNFSLFNLILRNIIVIEMEILFFILIWEKLINLNFLFNNVIYFFVYLDIVLFFYIIFMIGFIILFVKLIRVL